ncbi:MAG: hypothetical protein JSR37_03270 [Verrucomicrobia bacterium]|nr:hypothetical protein [Verrucomicrobiota bacterium]MBS0637084.1 hypothetical protein [Verrucomicrobiota bacterium]
MSIISTVSNQFTNIANVVTTNASALASKVSSFGGRVVSTVTPALQAVVSKVKSLNPPAFMQKAWNVVATRGGLGGALLAGSVVLLVKSTAADNGAIAKWAYRAGGVASLATAAILITTSYSFGFAKV